MRQLLQRGFRVSETERIQNKICGSDEWQIYRTTNSGSALAVTTRLFNEWAAMHPEIIDSFKECKENDCHIFCSRKEYLISSLENGPFPSNYRQIERLAEVFRKAHTDNPSNYSGAIYIEELRLLLPTKALDSSYDKAFAFGKWITGGVTVSATEADRTCQLMTWLSKESVLELTEKAGILAGSPSEAIKNNVIELKSVDLESNKKRPDAAPFVLPGRKDLEQFFNDNIIDIVFHQDQYKKMGIDFPGATILYGPPGCGKTFAIDKLTEYLGWNRFDIDAGSIASPYIHDTSKKISEVFEQAIEAAPSILVIDEMEAFLSDREGSGSSGTHHIEEVAEFLRRIPEAISRGVLIFAMTNLIDSIDKAVLRRGRFDHLVEVKMPTAEEIELLLKEKFESLPVEENVSPAFIAKALDGHPMSDITFVLREAGRFAVKNKKDRIDQDCFIGAIGLIPANKEKAPIGFSSSNKE